MNLIPATMSDQRKPRITADVLQQVLEDIKLAGVSATCLRAGLTINDYNNLKYGRSNNRKKLNKLHATALRIINENGLR